MSECVRHGLLVSASSLVFLTLVDQGGAQTLLPPIHVTAPSPIVRRAPPRPAPAAPAVTPAAPAEPSPILPSTEALPLGVLPIVTDQFATVTVVPNEELRRTPASTLGDLLFSKPGITGSSFAPGAASRPIIRGLDVNRVGIVENGIGAGGVSDLGEDHFVPIDPLMSDQVEVIRGPATLRYGSQSIGGVVSSTNNRIPDRMPPCRDFAPLAAYAALPSRRYRAPAVTGRAATSRCAARRRASTTGSKAACCSTPRPATSPSTPMPIGRKADDYRIPSYPYLFDPTRPFNGRQPNSFAAHQRQSIGASYIFDEGLRRRRGHAEQRALSHSRHRRRGSPDAHRRARDQVHQQGRVPPDGRRHRRGALLVRLHRLQAQRDRARRSARSYDRRRAPDLHQQGARRPRRGAAAAVQPALCGADDRARRAGGPARS